MAWDAPPNQGCSELRAAALALLYQNSSLGPWARTWGDEPPGAHLTLPPHQGVSHGLARCVPAHLPVSVSPSARTGSCSSLPTSCAGCLHPLAWGKQIPLAISFPCCCQCCADPKAQQGQFWGCRDDGWAPWDCGLSSQFLGMVFADPGESRGELPALCPPRQSPSAWEAGGTLPLENTSARFPGNLKQSKSSPRHASPSSVAGGHRGKFRGEQAEGDQNSLLQPKPVQHLHQRLQLPRLALSVCTRLPCWVLPHALKWLLTAG